MIERRDKLKLEHQLSLRRRFEANHGFIRAREAELFAREPLDGARVVLDGVDRHPQMPAQLFLLLNFCFQHEQIFAKALILFDEWQIPNENPQQAREEQEKNDHAAELVPNAEVDIHWGFP